MRRPLTVIALLLGGGLAVGCSPADAKTAPAPPALDSVTMPRAHAQHEMKEGAHAMGDYAYPQRAEFVAMMKMHLAEIQLEVDRLSAKVDRSNGAVKADAKIKLAAVREKWTAVKQRLDQAENATESTWNDVKHEYNKSFDELRADYAKTRQWVIDKMEL